MTARNGRLCWRHYLKATWLGMGSLMDLTGTTIQVQGRILMDGARKCPRCQRR